MKKDHMLTVIHYFLAFQKCSPELQQCALELFDQLANGNLDEGSVVATVELLKDILFPPVVNVSLRDLNPKCQ